MSEDKGMRALFERLQRIETRMVAGFEQLGVSVTSPEDWCVVDIVKHSVHLKGPGRSLKSIQLAIAAAGGDDGLFAVFVGGKAVATVEGRNHVY